MKEYSEKTKAIARIVFGVDMPTDVAKELQELSNAFYSLRCRKCQSLRKGSCLRTKRHHAKCPRRGCKTVKASYVMYPGQDGLRLSEVMPDGHTERVL